MNSYQDVDDLVAKLKSQGKSKSEIIVAAAESEIGWPYVWGGSSPSTSFDCSGFVCWVINNCADDTPGFTSFETTDATEEELQHLFPEISRFAGKCRFDNCRHIAEPECAVRQALDRGDISISRYESYLSQLEEIKERNSY